MIRTTIRVHDDFAKIDDAIRRRTVAALNEAARTGHAIASSKAAGVSDFDVIAARGTEDGFASGIRGNRLVRIFDKGSLGKRTARLAQPGRRKETWNVTRRGQTHVAERGDVSGKGIAPRGILAPARTAGRKALIAALRR